MTYVETINIDRYITEELESKLLKLVVGNRDIAYTVHIGVSGNYYIRLVKDDMYRLSASGMTFGAALLDLYKVLRDKKEDLC